MAYSGNQSDTCMRPGIGGDVKLFFKTFLKPMGVQKAPPLLRLDCEVFTAVYPTVWLSKADFIHELSVLSQHAHFYDVAYYKKLSGNSHRPVHRTNAPWDEERETWFEPEREKHFKRYITANAGAW
ncbi:MAG: hypothetical protein LUC93_04655 [Planctomycetaceae bacterium]|nr:hypothetical protein [Planctomycetaceae bacterium]